MSLNLMWLNLTEELYVVLQDSKDLCPQEFCRYGGLNDEVSRLTTVASSVKYRGFGIPGYLPMLQERSENSNSVSRIVSLCIEYIPNSPYSLGEKVHYSSVRILPCAGIDTYRYI